MSTKYILLSVGLVLIIVFILNRSSVDDSSNNNDMRKDKITHAFNNNTDSCLPSDDPAPPNYQRFWDYLSQDGIGSSNGEALFFLSETYQTLARLVSSLHVDLYDGPIYDKAHPVFPISQLLPNSKIAEKMMKFEKLVALSGDGDLYKLGSDMETDPLKSSTAKSITEVDDYYFADTRNILRHAKWARSESRNRLFHYLSNQTNPSPDAYRSWLLLIRLKDQASLNLESLTLHKVYVKGIMDSLSSEYSPLGLMFDAMPVFLKNGWLNKDDIVSALNAYDKEFAQDMYPLMTMLTEDDVGVEKLLSKDLSTLKISEYPDFSGRFIDHVCNYYYKKGEYEKAMIEITRFWYDDMKNHPMENLCFDNYPTFLLRSYLFGRWDGARLPLFLQDYRNVIGTDPVLKTGFEFFQRYNSEISRTFENTIN